MKAGRHAVVEGIVVLLMIGAMMASMTYQAETMDERVSMRLGPGDTNIDIIQEMDYGDEATFIMTNMDDIYSVEVVIVELDELSTLMDDDGIIWAELEGRSVSIAPGETHSFLIDQHGYWHLAVVHLNESAEGVVNTHISVEYNVEDRVTRSLVMSMPSLWMTGWVLHRLGRLKWEGRSWIDSTPSHAWNPMAESE